MSYQVLYRKYRPSNFDDVVGQEYIVKTLKNALEQNRIAHAYLFCGPRGTGKTSIAKLFAKMVNCINDKKPCGECKNCKAILNNTHPDVIELDAASNNGVDEIRSITDKVNYAPILGKYKVYIIDEVHMLSASAFNALLKTLEEPPADVIFILATTEPQKILATVLSRCQRYNFSKISKFDMKKRIKFILEKEDIEYEELALDLIISLADGGMRDALSILEEVLAYGNFKLMTNDVIKIYGLLSSAERVNLLKELRNSECSNIAYKLRDMYQNGIDIKRLTIDLIDILKELVFYKEGASELLETISLNEAKELDKLFNSQETFKMIEELVDVSEKANKTKQDILSYLEVSFIKMSHYLNKEKSNEVVKEKNEELKVEKPKTNFFAEAKADFEKIESQKIEVNKIQEKIEEQEIKQEVIKEDKKEEITAIKEELTYIDEVPVLDSDNFELQDNILKYELNYLLFILKDASKEVKTEDTKKIYNKLENYAYDSENYKYYTALRNTEIFGSQKDAIIFRSSDVEQVNRINDKVMNKELYFFLKNNFGIDKAIMAIDDETVKNIAAKYNIIDKMDFNGYSVKKYNEDKPNNVEEILNSMFMNVRVE